MANYNSLEDMMGNRENMECLVNNSRHDDDVMTGSSLMGRSYQIFSSAVTAL